MHTHVDEEEGINHQQPTWDARDRAELAFQEVDVDKGEDDGQDPIHRRRREHGDSHVEEPLP